MTDKVFYCYKVTNQVNGKIYIGFATNPKTRWRNHKRDADKGRGYVFHAAIRKHGWDNFAFEVIACGKDKREMLEFVEPALIKQHDCAVPNGYNIRRTAMIGPCFIQGKPCPEKLGIRFSPATEFKMGHKMASFTGHHHTTESKDKIKNKLQTTLLEPDKKENHQIASLGNRSRTGQKQSEEERSKRRLPQHIVDSAIELRMSGLTHREIADRLNEFGYKNKRNQLWATKAVSTLFERVRAKQ